MTSYQSKKISPGLSVGRYQWDQSVSFQYVDVFPPDATTFTVTGLQPVTVYNFSINALNAIGESDYADNNAVLTITTMCQFGITRASNPNKYKLQSSIRQWDIKHECFCPPCLLSTDRPGSDEDTPPEEPQSESFIVKSSLTITICRILAVCDWSKLVCVLLAITVGVFMVPTSYF